MPWNFPFLFAPGIQTSILMTESELGLAVAAMRQNSGRFFSGVGLYPRGALGGGGGVNSPAGTDVASVIVVCGKDSVARLSQEAAPAGAAAHAEVTGKIMSSAASTSA
jgi:hypothetical protein